MERKIKGGTIVGLVADEKPEKPEKAEPSEPKPAPKRTRKTNTGEE